MKAWSWYLAGLTASGRLAALHTAMLLRQTACWLRSVACNSMPVMQVCLACLAFSVLQATLCTSCKSARLPACQVAHGLAQFISLLGAEEAADGVDEPAPLQHLLALHQLPPPSLGGGASPQAVGAGGHGLSAAADVG